MRTVTPKFSTIKDWVAMTGLSERSTYNELGRGNLKAIKAGSRILIDVEAGLAWLRSCPPAQIAPPPPYDRTHFTKLTARTRERRAGMEP